MYILDKNTDYYDFYSHIYGVDKQITYDRRGSVLLSDKDLVDLSARHSIDRKNEVNHILLEAGKVQFIFSLTNFVIDTSCFPGDCIKGFDMELENVYTDNMHYFDAPVSIIGVVIDFHFLYGRGFGYNGRKYLYDRPFGEAVKSFIREPISNPILAKTRITNMVDGEDIWREVQTYISSIDNDKDVNLKMSDKEKAEIHGFDKYSFRHPIK